MEIDHDRDAEFGVDALQVPQKQLFIVRSTGPGDLERRVFDSRASGYRSAMLFADGIYIGGGVLLVILIILVILLVMRR